MNPHTGDLTITNTRLTDKGVYTFQQINSDGKISYRIIQMFVRGERIRTVELGGSVTLETDVTEIHTKIEWTLSREILPIAQMTVGSEPSYNSNDERFRDRLMMDPKTGDLIITNITAELTEDYAVNIHSPRRETEYRIYIVASLVIADKGESVTLHTDCEIQSDSEIKWMLDDVFRLVTVKNKENSEIKYSDDERFRGRLEMNSETGDLTITHIRQTDTGVYKFHHFISYENTSCRAFRILFRGNKETESTTVLMPLLNEAEDVDRSADVQDHIINIYSKKSSLLS
ncbi:uncharacterized protein LOC130429648 [Triplophysa dalaica]|uniref:uncharacterized protein LOC130429648 n=1 Tax=Triplophysa dalaica TaxID=1582913 RepID=UPI0024DFA250|nr:uncharacterized protein LOC130429648 [Triplophysa dalaica]XP_056614299.1 uncharacterized protein LOC130429648 [Triplophysa dalaica]XP_056614300.1 uncharacterized protein LOC130429648 [Triplophysa dalaica]XP_056614302.1 uncharacterized protein LOC130429648 [Triplophysa dalaica]